MYLFLLSQRNCNTGGTKRTSPALFPDLISDSAHCLDQISCIAQLLSQSPDMNIHGTPFPVKSISPDLIKKLCSGKNDSAVFQKKTQHLILFQRKIYRLFVDCHHMSGTGIHKDFRSCIPALCLPASEAEP